MWRASRCLYQPWLLYLYHELPVATAGVLSDLTWRRARIAFVVTTWIPVIGSN